MKWLHRIHLLDEEDAEVAARLTHTQLVDAVEERFTDANRLAESSRTEMIIEACARTLSDEEGSRSCVVSWKTDGTGTPMECLYVWWANELRD